MYLNNLAEQFQSKLLFQSLDIELILIFEPSTDFITSFLGKLAKILFVNLSTGVNNVQVDHLNLLMVALVPHLCLLMAAQVALVWSQSIQETLSVHPQATHFLPRQILFQLEIVILSQALPLIPMDPLLLLL